MSIAHHTSWFVTFPRDMTFLEVHCRLTESSVPIAVLGPENSSAQALRQQRPCHRRPVHAVARLHSVLTVSCHSLLKTERTLES